jgi:DNA-binding transcriptional ArsR family regulator
METIVTSDEQDTPDPRPLDRILGSRSHVRVLRAMMTKDPGHNVGVRDVADMAGISHPRVAQVLSDLSGAGLVERHDTGRGPVYELNDEHYLAPQLFYLFDDEMHVILAVEGFVRGEARKTRRQVRVRTVPGAVVVSFMHEDREDDLRWLEELEDAITVRFGLDMRVTAPKPDGWRFMPA